MFAVGVGTGRIWNGASVMDEYDYDGWQGKSKIEREKSSQRLRTDLEVVLLLLVQLFKWAKVEKVEG